VRRHQVRDAFRAESHELAVAENPRIDDLRRRLDKDPGSRLFAQLAEELRKDGDLEEAIRVSREGLHKHPAYPSARMTLGRALLDTGDLAAARTEFEIVLKSAPDNILASRFLGECLEGLGDLAGARDRFKATLALAPGDKVVTAHLQDVEAKLKKAAPAGAAPAPAGAAPAATGVPRAPAEPAAAPIPLSRVDEPMELERSPEARTAASRPEPGASPESTVMMSAMPVPPAPPAPKDEAPEPPPIPLVAAEEDFELERPYEPPSVGAPPAEPAPAVHTAAPPAAAGGFESTGPAAEFEFDLAPEGGTTGPVPEPWQPTSPATVRLPETSPEPAPEAEPPIPPPPPAIAAPVPPLPTPISPPRPEVPERAAPAAPPLPPPVFAPAPPPPARPRMDAVPAPEADELTSSTLAELYFNQGFTDKAIEVYRQLLQREPGNERGRARLADLEALERRLAEEEARAAPPAGGGPADAAAARRQAIERTITRLEGLLAALRRQ
jgi:tetratricopeptide (TPR) repeat protein